MSTAADDAQNAIRKAMELKAAGQLPEALKLLRDQLGLELSQSQELLDGLSAGRPVKVHATIRSTSHQRLSPETQAEVRQLLASGNKLEAVKRLREVFPVDLKTAMDLADSMESGTALSVSAPVAARPPEDPLSNDSAWAAIDRVARAGNTIEAIKLHRQAFGSSLAEAKAAVESRVGSSTGIPQTPFPAQVDEPQTLLQRLGLPGLVFVGLVMLGVLVACGAVALMAFNVR